jgi:hypothetical protein
MKVYQIQSRLIDEEFSPVLKDIVYCDRAKALDRIASYVVGFVAMPHDTWVLDVDPSEHVIFRIKELFAI